MKPGDIVHHRRSARRMTVESLDGKVAVCVWWDGDGTFRRASYVVSWLAPVTEALA